MFNLLISLAGKSLSKSVQLANLGNGSTWPGHIALKLNRNYIRDLIKQSQTKIIIVAGTNGKTTTSKLITNFIEKNTKRVIKNDSGANLLNGIASSLILNTSLTGELTKDFAVFEVDENALPLVLKEITPDYLVLLNPFRDQLDRYGEVNTIATKWQNAIKHLPEKTQLILNADDPQIAFLGTSTKKKPYFFSIENSEKKSVLEHSVDSIYCPQCGEKLTYTSLTYSHLGNWKCTKCGLQRPHIQLQNAPSYPLPGTYNQYNIHAAVAVAKLINIPYETIQKTLEKFTPVFGRQEQIVLNGKKINIFLSKNPTGFSESLRTIKQLGAKNILFVLNDRIPDGKDISWIWDTDIENILDGSEHVTISGDRVYDMALRMKYCDKFKVQNSKLKIEEDLDRAIEIALESVKNGETLYIIPTYSAMLDVRKILTGGKIL